MRYLPALAIVLLSVPSHLDLDAQIIDFSPFPMSGDDQYQGIPSERRSMGNLSIALRDELADAFINPAEIMRVSRNQIFFSPTFQSWDAAARGAMMNLSLNGGIVYHNGSFGIAALAGIDYRTSESEEWINTGISLTSPPPYVINITDPGRRFPVMIAGGGRIPGSSIDIGTTVAWTSMNGGDQTMLLSQEPDRITFTGDEYQIRLGASTPIGTGGVGMIAGISILNLDRTIASLDFLSNDQHSPRLRDHGHTWFARLNYRLPLGEHFDLGVQATENRTELQTISGGTRHATTSITHAFDAGIGATWRIPGWLVALEYLVEPGFADVMDERVMYNQQPNGHLVESSKIPLSGRDDFFMRHALRAGVQIDLPADVMLRIGSQVRTTAYSYDCIGKNSTDVIYSSPKSRWTEISLSSGLQIDLGPCRLMADGEIVAGRGLPGDPAQYSRRTPHPSSLCLTPPTIITPLHGRDRPMLTGRLAVLWALGAE